MSKSDDRQDNAAEDLVLSMFPNVLIQTDGPDRSPKAHPDTTIALSGHWLAAPMELKFSSKDNKAVSVFRGAVNGPNQGHLLRLQERPLLIGFGNKARTRVDELWFLHPIKHKLYRAWIEKLKREAESHLALMNYLSEGKDLTIFPKRIVKAAYKKYFNDPSLPYMIVKSGVWIAPLNCEANLRHVLGEFDRPTINDSSFDPFFSWE